MPCIARVHWRHAGTRCWRRLPNRRPSCSDAASSTHEPNGLPALQGSQPSHPSSPANTTDKGPPTLTKKMKYRIQRNYYVSSPELLHKSRSMTTRVTFYLHDTTLTWKIPHFWYHTTQMQIWINRKTQKLVKCWKFHLKFKIQSWHWQSRVRNSWIRKQSVVC